MASPKRFTLKKPLILGAIVLGVAAGSYGVAAAASSSSASPAATASSAATPTTAPKADGERGQHGAPPGATDQNPWGNKRGDETLLIGDTLAKVKAAALAKVGSGATVVRAETDADGHAAYEAHVLKSDGTPVTVYVDKSFNVVSVESGPAHGERGQHGAPPGATDQNPWGNKRGDETLLIGDTLAKVKAAALAKVGSGATVVRAETDADGHAAYEAHVLKSDGTPVTVYVDKSFNVVSVESG